MSLSHSRVNAITKEQSPFRRLERIALVDRGTYPFHEQQEPSRGPLALSGPGLVQTVPFVRVRVGLAIPIGQLLCVI
jgi:hypothetical protein